MYGQTAKGVGAGALPFTGIEIAGWVLAAITLVFVGIALYQLARPASKDLP